MWWRWTDPIGGPGERKEKSDPLDAYSAARAALGRASVVPKVRDGKVEAIRAIRVARSSAVKARTQATNPKMDLTRWVAGLPV